MSNFYHDDQIMQGFRDFRSDVSKPPRLNSIFHIALRVKTGNATWYHHTAMAIDGNLFSHVESLKWMLRCSLNRPKAEISCVYVSSFIRLDPSFMITDNQQNLLKTMNDRIEKGAIFSDEVKQIMVLGYLGKENMILLDAATHDAMEAIKAAINKCIEQYKETLLPINIMAVSPAMPGIINIFEQRAPQLIAHVNSTCSVG